MSWDGNQKEAVRRYFNPSLALPNNGRFVVVLCSPLYIPRYNETEMLVSLLLMQRKDLIRHQEVYCGPISVMLCHALQGDVMIYLSEARYYKRWSVYLPIGSGSVEEEDGIGYLGGEAGCASICFWVKIGIDRKQRRHGHVPLDWSIIRIGFSCILRAIGNRR